MKQATPFYKQTFFIMFVSIFILILLIVVITFLTSDRNKPEQSVTLSYEIDTRTMSKKEVEDLVNEYLIPTLKKQVSNGEPDFTWQYNETGIQVFTVTDAQTINNLKKFNTVIKLQLPAYVKIKEIAQRQKSEKKLQQLADMLAKYTVGNNEKYPISLDELKQYDVENLLPWLHENIEYLNKGKDMSDHPDIAIAYDKRLLEKGTGTNVLFIGGLVNFVRPNELEKLGIVLSVK
jgi:hypothetical protein